MRRASIALFTLALGACGHGHYATRESTPEPVPEPVPETETETVAETETVPESETETVPESETVAETETESVAEAENAPSDRMGTAPEAERQQQAAEARPRVGIQVRTVTPPVTPTIARRVMQLQSAQLEHCYASALVNDASIAGTVRVTLTVASGGSATAELETMAPSLDRVLPCLDRALERARFPVTDGGPSHVVVELGFSP